MLIVLRMANIKIILVLALSFTTTGEFIRTLSSFYLNEFLLHKLLLNPNEKHFWMKKAKSLVLMKVNVMKDKSGISKSVSV